MKIGIKQSGAFASVCLSLLMLSGCFNSSNSSNDNNQSISNDLASQSPNSSSGGLDDPTTLKSDLDALFGKANDQPVDIETGETLQEVFDRVRS